MGPPGPYPDMGSPHKGPPGPHPDMGPPHKGPPGPHPDMHPPHKGGGKKKYLLDPFVFFGSTVLLFIYLFIYCLSIFLYAIFRMKECQPLPQQYPSDHPKRVFVIIACIVRSTCTHTFH